MEKELKTYVTKNLIQHDGRSYAIGASIKLTDIEARRIKNSLVHNSADLISADNPQVSDLMKDNEKLKAEIAALKSKPKKGK